MTLPLLLQRVREASGPVTVHGTCVSPFVFCAIDQRAA